MKLLTLRQNAFVYLSGTNKAQEHIPQMRKVRADSRASNPGEPENTGFVW